MRAEVSYEQNNFLALGISFLRVMAVPSRSIRETNGLEKMFGM